MGPDTSRRSAAIRLCRRPSRTALALSACLAAACAAPSSRADDNHPARAAWSASAPAVPASAFSAHDHRVAALGAGADGRLHGLFLDDANGDGYTDRLLYASASGDRWSAPVVLDATPASTAQPQLVVDGAGSVHALWLEGNGDGEPARLGRLLHRVRAGDGRWSAPASPYAADSAGIPPHLAAAAGADGSVHVLVSRVRDASLAHLAYAGGRWGPPRPAGQSGAGPRLVAGPDSALLLADLRPSYVPLLAGGAGSFHDPWVRAYRGGAWSEPVPVHPSPRQHSHAPQLARDARGVLHAVWTEGERGSLLPTRLLHATSPDGQTWSEPADLLPPGNRQTLYSPRLLVAGGGLHLTFARFGEGVTSPRHFHAVFDGERWTPPAEILPAEGARDSELETAVDPAGTLHALWKGADGGYHHARLTTAAR